LAGESETTRWLPTWTTILACALFVLPTANADSVATTLPDSGGRVPVDAPGDAVKLCHPLPGMTVCAPPVPRTPDKAGPSQCPFTSDPTWAPTFDPPTKRYDGTGPILVTTMFTWRSDYCPPDDGARDYDLERLVLGDGNEVCFMAAHVNGQNGVFLSTFHGTPGSFSAPVAMEGHCGQPWGTVRFSLTVPTTHTMALTFGWRYATPQGGGVCHVVLDAIRDPRQTEWTVDAQTYTPCAGLIGIDVGRPLPTTDPLGNVIAIGP
jgi:hypothetical protein